MIALREIKQGEYIKRTNEAKKVYIKAHYNRAGYELVAKLVYDFLINHRIMSRN